MPVGTWTRSALPLGALGILRATLALLISVVIGLVASVVRLTGLAMGPVPLRLAVSTLAVLVRPPLSVTLAVALGVALAVALGIPLAVSLGIPLAMIARVVRHVPAPLRSKRL